MKSCVSLTGVAMASCLGGAVHGQTFTGAGGLIDDSVGPPATTVFQIMVAEGAGTVTGLDVVSLIGLSHSYCGDLGIQIRHNGLKVDLVNRIGYPTSGIYGDSSDFGGNYSFSDDSFLNIWTMAGAVGPDTAILQGTYRASKDGGALVNIASAFNGMDASGAWELLITDYQSDTQGNLGQWSFSISTVPAPGALALLACAGAVGGSRRRRGDRGRMVAMDSRNGEGWNMSKGTVGLSLIMAAALSSSALAGITYSGPGGTLLDPPGQSMTSWSDFTIHVTDQGQVSNLASVTLAGLAHTWSGDLSVELIHNGVSVTLVHRIGYLGGMSFGDSSNFGGDYTFTDQSNDSIWAAANAGSSGYTIPSASYYASGLSGIRIDIASAFAGADLAGDWTLRIGDWASTQSGSLTSWSFDVGVVPAPGALALTAVAGMVGASGRRRR